MIIPEQYKAFLQKYNGGDTPKTKFKMGRSYSDLKDFIKRCKSEKIGEVPSIKERKERKESLIANGRAQVITESLRKMWQAEIDKYANMVQEEIILD